MHWKTDYRAKLTTIEDALKAVQSGDHVTLSHAAGESRALSEALAIRAAALEDVVLHHVLMTGAVPFCSPEMQRHLRHNTLFAGPQTREAVNRGRADFTPVFFSEVPRLFRDGILQVDVALINVSTPDEHGFMSFGISVDYTRTAAYCAKKVVAAVNPCMPRTLGDAFIHVSAIDHIVEIDEPLFELPQPQIGPVERAIGEQVAALIEDGSTLQLGIGAIPDAVLLFLKEKRELGIHSEMFSDRVIELFHAGVITNQAKTLHRGKMIATFLMGTRKLYDFVDNNPAVEMHPVDYTNDPLVIGRNRKMIAINAALEIDLTGQVCADSIGYKQYSGVGGQVDFVRGAARSEGGKAIFVLPSTALNGTVSRIVTTLSEGAAVTTSRNEVQYVVTEYGAVNLYGKSLRQRADALIGIAHPDFRRELAKEARQRRSLNLAVNPLASGS